MDPFLRDVLASDQDVFTFKELLFMFQTADAHNLKSRLSYYVSRGIFIPVRRGIYAKRAGYNPWHVATKIMSPSYISFETVLVKAGVIFQHYPQIFVASHHISTHILSGT